MELEAMVSSGWTGAEDMDMNAVDMNRLEQLRAEPCLPASDFCTVSTFVPLSPSGPHLRTQRRGPLEQSQSLPIQLASVPPPGLGSTSILREKRFRVPWACPRRL